MADALPNEKILVGMSCSSESHNRPRPRKPATLKRRVCSCSLEGSRFGACLVILVNFAPAPGPPKRVKAGGSRERLYGFADLWRRHNQSESGRITTSRRSREPPVFTRFLRDWRKGEIRGSAGRKPKRLPSRRWEQTRLINMPTFSRTACPTKHPGA
jgi:hypothetical protein